MLMRSSSRRTESRGNGGQQSRAPEPSEVAPLVYIILGQKVDKRVAEVSSRPVCNGTSSAGRRVADVERGKRRYAVTRALAASSDAQMWTDWRVIEVTSNRGKWRRKRLFRGQNLVTEDGRPDSGPPLGGCG